MFNHVLIFVGVALLFSIYIYLKVELVSSNISVKRYFDLAKENNFTDIKEVFLRITLMALNLFIILYCLNLSLFSSDVSLNYNTGLLSLFIVSDVTLFYILHMKFIKQRHDILVLLRIGILDVLISLMILAALVIHIQGVYIIDLVLYQNELIFGIPKWNIIVLLPLYYLWNACRIDTVRALPIKSMPHEIDRFQMRALYAIRTTSWLMLSIVLFMGGSSLFEFFDNFNLSHNTLKLIELVFIIVKFIFLILLIRLYSRFVGPKKVVEVEKLYRKRALLAIIVFLLIAAYKVATI